MFSFINHYHQYRRRKEMACKLSTFAAFLANMNVHVLCVDLPRKDRIRNLTPFEKERIDQWTFDFNNIQNEKDRICQLYPGKTYEYIESLYQGVFVFNNGKRKALRDYYSNNVNIIGGQRRTTDQPACYSHTIYTLGACTMRGTGVEDSNTVASILQRIINLHFGESYRVVNLAIGFGSDFNDDIVALQEQKIDNGDLVVWGIYGMLSDMGEEFVRSLGFYYIDTNEIIEERELSQYWFTDNTLHTTEVGNQLIANSVYNGLNRNHMIGKCKGEKKNQTLLSGNSIDVSNSVFVNYLDSLAKYKKPTIGRNGCIVMNCNPFTNGHKFLVEYASKKVDTLYVFVVEENKSMFSFNDRKKMVELGTKDMYNVVVLGSGSFIISAITFPGYFVKDNIKNCAIDCSTDLTLFSKYIAPMLDIKVRFAGEEPLDPITSQYNQAMSEILPQFGIEFDTIKRMEFEGEVISASRVRNCIDEDRISEIKEMVPPSTYDIINEYYHS